jgi:hypothetical protein
MYHDDCDHYKRVGRKGSKTLYFSRSEQENETWVYVDRHFFIRGTPILFLYTPL